MYSFIKDDMNTIPIHLQTILQQIRDFESRYDRIPNSVKLLAVTKHQSIENIQTAINAGHELFGESYLQEALIKIEHFKKNINLDWHFIGPIQSNKTKKIAEHFSFVHSVDSLKIAELLHKHRPTYLPPLSVCIQINVSGEKNKSGIDPADVFTLAEKINSFSNLKLRGLMTVPAMTDNFGAQRAQLHRLKLLYEQLIQKDFKIDTLSMGMTNDLEAAIAEGATLVRIGTAIFGSRI